MNIKTIAKQGLLAEASYGDFRGANTDTRVKAALQAKGFSAIQSEEFTAHWRVISHQPNTNHGFSATVFEALDENLNGTGEFSFAIRGSEPALFTTQSDWLSNIGDVGPDGIAIHQAIDLYSYYLRLTATGDDVVQYTYHEETTLLNSLGIVVLVPPHISSETVATDTFADQSQMGVLAGQQFSVTGHSLGGHLALIMDRLAPAMVTAVDTFNAVGFDTSLSVKPHPLTSEGFFNLLRDASDAPISNGWNAGEINRLEVKGDIVSEIGNFPTSQQLLFSETENEGPINAHDIDKISDALAVYKLLSPLAPGASLGQLTTILEQSTNKIEESLEAIVNALGDMLNKGQTVAIDIRNELYARIKAIADEIYTSQFDQTLKPEYTNLRVVTVDSIADSATANTPEGLAYRYALVELNPFAVVGLDQTTSDAIYKSTHNANGELDWYNPATGQGTLSTAYLKDRAEMLRELLQDNASDSDYNDAIRWSDRYYHDNASGEGLGDTDAGKQILFSDFRSEGLAGSDGNDRLYGGEGDDILNGKQGHDYLEGGTGNDTYIYNSGTYTSGHGWDTILDTDGVGSISWNGTPLGSAQLKVESEPYLFIDTVRNISFTFTENADFATSERGTLTITEADTYGGIKIENYKLGDLGLTEPTTVVEEPLTEYSQTTTADMPILTYIDVAAINDISFDEYNDYLLADLQLTALDDQDNVLIGASGNDRFKGGTGNDHIFLNGGDDLVTAGAGDDVITAGWGFNSVYAGEGNDVLLMGG